MFSRVSARKLAVVVVGSRPRCRKVVVRFCISAAHEWEDGSGTAGVDEVGSEVMVNTARRAGPGFMERDVALACRAFWDERVSGVYW